VYLNSEAPFAKSGSYEMGLPKLDIPVNVLTWEISLPDRLEVRQFAGNAMAADLFPTAAQSVFTSTADDLSETDSYVFSQSSVDMETLGAGQIGGIVADPTGAVIPNAEITVVNKQTGQSVTARSDGDGRWVVSGMQPGPVRVSVVSPGFKSNQQELELGGSRSAKLGTTLEVGGVTETVTVTSGDSNVESNGRRVEDQVRKNQAAQMNAPSQNVFSLQRRVAGILPVRVEVPRAGKSYRFVRPLVMEEETKVSFQYKSK
jgi:hypothetical protein